MSPKSPQFTEPKKAPILGVLGGLGPPTTAKLYLQLVKALTVGGNRPQICVWNVAVNESAERDFIEHGGSRAHFVQKLQEGARALERSGCDLIIVPCNTVHVLLADVQQAVSVPILNMVALTAREVLQRGWSSVLLLATSTTVATRLYQNELQNHGVEVVVPKSFDQSRIDRAVLSLINGRGIDEARRLLRAVVSRSKTQGIVLGCTDLQMVLSEDDRTVDSVQSLMRAVVSCWEKRSEAL
ncbi:MAG: amino acid racemase [Candidatus Andersenbacteria bacterium]